MTDDDVLFRFRLRLFALASELGSVRAACRAMGVHPSTYYRWRVRLLRYGREGLRPRERRLPRMANATPVWLEQRVLAFALGHPGLGPRRIAAELARPVWGAHAISANGVWRVLARHGLSTRERRLGLVCGYAAPPEALPREHEPERHLEASRPGELLQMDCFLIGRLSGTAGCVWQYTAIDVASSYVWACLHASPRNPRATHASALARRAAADLAAAGWRLERVTTDHGGEFRSGSFASTIAGLGAVRAFISAGRPQSNGCVERVQRTILEECWKLAFARHLIPRYEGLRGDLDAYLDYYNNQRAHTGRWNRGRTPVEVLGKAACYA